MPNRLQNDKNGKQHRSHDLCDADIFFKEDNSVKEGDKHPAEHHKHTVNGKATEGQHLDADHIIGDHNDGEDRCPKSRNGRKADREAAGAEENQCAHKAVPTSMTSEAVAV